MGVTLVRPYDPEWLSWLEQIRDRVAGGLGELRYRIEHVGSTAIPGMTAKPIIDLDIVIEQGTFPLAEEGLSKLGYVHRGDLGVAGREAFGIGDAKLTAALPVHHLYVCPQDSHALRRHLAYRDFMRVHPEWVRRLSELKVSLCEMYNNDADKYMDGKVDMYEEITALGLASGSEGSGI